MHKEQNSEILQLRSKLNIILIFRNDVMCYGVLKLIYFANTFFFKLQSVLTKQVHFIF